MCLQIGWNRLPHFFALFALLCWKLLNPGLTLRALISYCLERFAAKSSSWRLILKPNICFNYISSQGPSWLVLTAPCGEWGGCCSKKPKSSPRSLLRWQVSHPPHSGLTHGFWVPRGVFLVFTCFAEWWQPPGASAKPLLIPSCLCQRLRSVGSLPAQTSYGRSGRHCTVCVTSHLLCRRQSQVSGHVLRLCQGITSKSIQTRITGWVAGLIVDTTCSKAVHE